MDWIRSMSSKLRGFSSCCGGQVLLDAFEKVAELAVGDEDRCLLDGLPPLTTTTRDRPKLGVDFPKAWIEAFKGQFDPREALEHHVHAWDNSAHLDWLAETAVDALLAQRLPARNGDQLRARRNRRGQLGPSLRFFVAAVCRLRPRPDLGSGCAGGCVEASRP